MKLTIPQTIFWRTIAIILALSGLCFNTIAQTGHFDFYNSKDGLKSNGCSQLAQDNSGLIWFLNDGQLCRFDGRRFVYPNLDDQSMGRLKVLINYSDSLLCLASSKRIWLYNPKRNTTTEVLIPEEEIDGFQITKFFFSRTNDISIMAFSKGQGDRVRYWRLRNGELGFELETKKSTAYVRDYFLAYDEHGNKFYSDNQLIIRQEAGTEIRDTLIGDFFVDNRIDFLFTEEEDFYFLFKEKLYTYDKEVRQLTPHRANQYFSRERPFYDFGYDRQNGLWFCGPEHTIVHYDLELDTLLNYSHVVEKDYPYLSVLPELVLGKDGVLWFPSTLGLGKLNPTQNKFETFLDGFEEACNGGSCSLRGITEDDQGNIYGTFYRGLYKITKDGQAFLREEGRARPHGIIYKSGFLWDNPKVRFDIDSLNIKRLGTEGKLHREPGLFVEDKFGKSWWLGRTKIYSSDKRDKSQWNLGSAFSDKSGYITDAACITYEPYILWISKGGSLLKHDPTAGSFDNIQLKMEATGISRIFSLIPDKDGQFWMATNKGLILYSLKDGIIENYNSTHGLSNDYVCSMLAEGDSCLWMGTNNGLSRFNRRTKEFTNFFIQDGLTHNEFNRVSSYQSKSGKMYFGGLQGLNVFDPSELIKNSSKKKPAANLVLTSFEKTEGQENKIVSLYHFDPKENLEIFYGDRSLKFDFALTNYSNPNLVKYSYMIQGLDKNWSRLSNDNFVRYGSIRSGNYTLRVRAKYYDGTWHDQELKVGIRVNPPWWATNMAYLAYLLAFMSTMWGIYRFLRRRWLLKGQLENEKKEAERLKELDNFKSMFYTNLTHEFRTPLTVILGMTEQIQKNPKVDSKKALSLIGRNGKNLLRLINQMLDLSKIKNKAFKLHLTQRDVVSYLKYVLESFQSFASNKNLGLSFYSNEEACLMDFDAEQLKQVLVNLISNAIKYNQDGGQIHVKVFRQDDQLEVRVEDTGIGIPTKDIPKIFDRFYRAESQESEDNLGTGIGLSHTKELLRIMGGDIYLESNSDPTQGPTGSKFTFYLPITNEAPLSPNIGASRVSKSEKTITPDNNFKNEARTSDSKARLLIVEDNPDVVEYLKMSVGTEYTVSVAYNGAIGIQKAIAEVPDIIISDVMMPEKDGFELCETLKNHQVTSHIPIVLLTAKADMQSKIKGLQTGADAYLRKPFNKEELAVRLEQLLVIRQKLKSRYAEHPLLTDFEKNTKPLSKEDLFVGKAIESVNKHISDADFNPVRLARELGMSQAQLYRKVKALMGTTPSIFIRKRRLAKAKELLKNRELNISEIAYQLGFSDPAYFSRIFSETFGSSPSENRN